MASDFSRTLALLRHEKKLSQRAAATALQVSQALLSHYENGLREPGLSFVVRAADYYGVSCDYLLGRSMSRAGAGVPSNHAAGAGEAANQQVIEALRLLFLLVERSGSRQLPRALEEYLSVAVYRAYRYLYAAAPESVDQIFRTRGEHFDALCDAEQKLSELRLRTAARGGGEFGLESERFLLPPLSPAALGELDPEGAAALLTLLQTVTEALTALSGHEH